MKPARQYRWGEDLPSDEDDAMARLLDAAERCFKRWGPSRTSLEDVAAEAHVSRATVYRYLGSRGQLFASLLLRLQHRGWAAESGADGQAAPERLVEILLVGRDAVLEYGEPGLVDQLAHSQPLIEQSRELYAAWLARARDEGHLRPDVDIDSAVEWVLFIRTAVWRDNVTERDHLRKMLLQTFAPSLFVSAPVAETPKRARPRAAQKKG